MRSRFAVAIGLASSLSFVSVSAWSATPPTVPFSAAPASERSRGFPVCASADVRGLPNRAAFERDAPLHLSPEPLPNRTKASMSQYGSEYSAVRNVPIRLNHAAFGLTFLNARELPDGRLVWYIAVNRGDSPLPLRAFVARFRTELGFRDGDWPELVGNRFFRRYANGAISLRHFGDQQPESVHEEPRPRTPSLGYSGLLPAPADGLAAPPDLTGTEALAIVHDMNPYLDFIPLEGPGPSLAARLVVVSGVDWDPRLAWEVRYRFACWEAGIGAERPFLLEDSAYAYVDARAG